MQPHIIARTLASTNQRIRALSRFCVAGRLVTLKAQTNETKKQNSMQAHQPPCFGTCTARTASCNSTRAVTRQEMSSKHRRATCAKVDRRSCKMTRYGRSLLQCKLRWAILTPSQLEPGSRHLLKQQPLKLQCIDTSLARSPRLVESTPPHQGEKHSEHPQAAGRWLRLCPPALSLSLSLSGLATSDSQSPAHTGKSVLVTPACSSLRATPLSVSRLPEPVHGPHVYGHEGNLNAIQGASTFLSCTALGAVSKKKQIILLLALRIFGSLGARR